jgi:hypothetical protein
MRQYQPRSNHGLGDGELHRGCSESSRPTPCSPPATRPCRRPTLLSAAHSSSSTTAATADSRVPSSSVSHAGKALFGQEVVVGRCLVRGGEKQSIEGEGGLDFSREERKDQSKRRSLSYQTRENQAEDTSVVESSVNFWKKGNLTQERYCRCTKWTSTVKNC